MIMGFIRQRLCTHARTHTRFDVGVEAYTQVCTHDVRDAAAYAVRPLQAVECMQPSIPNLRKPYSQKVPLPQVRECATALLHIAKRERIPIFLIGHVTKACCYPRMAPALEPLTAADVKST